MSSINWSKKGYYLLLSKLEKYNVRLVCATTHPLAELTAQGSYNPRYMILSSLCISVPSLRMHREDIPEQSIRYYRIVLNRVKPLIHFKVPALNTLRNYDWPGNLSQLTSVVRSLALTCSGNEISAEVAQQALASPLPSSISITPDIPLKISLREARDLFEKNYFEKLIDQEGGNMTRVAERAGLERTHLYRKIKTLGIKLRNQNG